MSRDVPARATTLLIVAMLTMAAVLLFVRGLGNVQLRDWDEATFASIAREMTETGAWLRPTLFGEPYLNKPPLLFWLTAVSYQAGGINEATTRLPAALVSALGVPLLFLAARRIFGRESPALMSAVVYLTLLPVVRHGRLAMIDGMVNTFLIAVLYCVARGSASRRWLVGAGVGLALVAMAKGLLVVAVAAVIGVWVLWMSWGRLLRSPWLWLGLTIGFAPVLAWYVAQVSVYGTTFVDVHVLAQGIDRVTGVVEGHRRPPWFYLIEMAKTTVPWLLFAVPAVVQASRSRRDSWERLVLAGGGGFLLIISVMPTKLPWYVMPCYVFLALAAGWQLARLWEPRNAYPRVVAAALLVCAVAAASALVFQARVGRTPPPIGAGALAVAACAGAGLLVARHSRYVVPVLAGGLYAALLSFVATPLWNWEVNEAFDVRPVATLIAAHAPPGAQVRMAFPYERPSLNFYARRRIAPLTSADGLPGAYVLADERDADRREATRVLGRAGPFVLVAPAHDRRDVGGAR